MEILTQLGINFTVFIQFALYIGTFSFLVLFVYKPYAESYQKRIESTRGAEDLAESFKKKTADLQAEYEKAAQDIHAKIQEAFKKQKQDAQLKAEAIIQLAKEAAQKEIQEHKKAIQSSVAAASTELRPQTTQLSLLITNKLLGK